MQLLTPFSLSWLGLLVPLLALYILRRRHTTRVVSSTLLWNAAIRDMQAERPWERLRPYLSLIIQSVALIAGALALANPVWATRAPEADYLVIVLDSSTSMDASEGAETRLLRARRSIRSLVDSLPSSTEVALIDAADAPTLVAPLKSSRAELNRALEAIRSSGPNDSLEPALRLAADQLTSNPRRGTILAYTDSAFPGQVTLPSVATEVRRVGDAASNNAIIESSLRVIEQTDSAVTVSIRASVVRFGSGTCECYVTASLVENGRALDSQRVGLTPGATSPITLRATLPVTPARPPLIQVELHPVHLERCDDRLDSDDRVFLAGPLSRVLPVHVRGAISTSVERALRSDIGVAIDHADADAPPGLWVFTQTIPNPLPSGPILLLDAQSNLDAIGTSVGEAIARPPIISWVRAHPLLRFVTLSDVRVESARTLRAIEPLILTTRGAIAGFTDLGDREAVVIGFDPDESTWPERTSFVVFIRNVIERARESRLRLFAETGELGDPIRLVRQDASDDGEGRPGQAGLTSLRVVTPSGNVRELPPYARTFGDTAAPGVYQIESSHGVRYALRNLHSREESNLEARAVYRQPDGSPADALALSQESASNAADSTAWPPWWGGSRLWPWLAGLMLLVLVAEVVWSSGRGAGS